MLKVRDDLYNAVLGLVDLVRGTNSYYKFQVLEADSGKRFVCMRVRLCVCNMFVHVMCHGEPCIPSHRRIVHISQ